MWGSLTCGGQGHRSPTGGSRLAPGSSQTSPALCGTRLSAADPGRRAAPPEEQRWCHGTRGATGHQPRVGAEENQRGEGLGGSSRTSLQGPCKPEWAGGGGTFRYWAALCTFQLWLCRAAWHSSVVTPCTMACSWAHPPTWSAPLGPTPLGPSGSCPSSPDSKV